VKEFEEGSSKVKETCCTSFGVSSETERVVGGKDEGRGVEVGEVE